LAGILSLCDDAALVLFGFVGERSELKKFTSQVYGIRAEGENALPGNEVNRRLSCSQLLLRAVYEHVHF
jgi:hypothetical protein